MSEEGPSREATEPYAGGEDLLKSSSADVIRRRSRWESSLAGLRYVFSISHDNDIQLRDTDRATTYALLIVSVVAAVSLIVPQLSAPRIPLVIAADVLVGVALLMYVCNRFGIVTTMTPRQALLTWQLMLGSALLGMFVAVNLGLVSTVILSGSQSSGLTTTEPSEIP